MNARLIALAGARVFDGARMLERHAVLLDGGTVLDLVHEDSIPADAVREKFDGGILAPGFVDLQVNGGGGVMFNDGLDCSREPGAIARIVAAHRRFGTTALLPTLITAPYADTARAIEAAARAVATIPGAIGLHLEGPHLAASRKGAHDAALMRPLTGADVDRLIAARARVGVLMVTLATEQASPALIRRLADAGVIVSLGHSDASYDAARAAFDAGARAATHLFNAMSPLGNREPGLVGAALDTPHVQSGLIADGHHVHPACLRLALARPEKIFLVTDAMATVGSDIDGFVLGGRPVRRAGGRLTLADGTLAGADIDMAASLRFVVSLGIPLETALRLTSTHAATLIGDDGRGRIAPGARADLVHLDDMLHVKQSWLGGASADALPDQAGT